MVDDSQKPKSDFCCCPGIYCLIHGYIEVRKQRDKRDVDTDIGQQGVGWPCSIEKDRLAEEYSLETRKCLDYSIINAFKAGYDSRNKRNGIEET